MTCKQAAVLKWIAWLFVIKAAAVLLVVMFLIAPSHGRDFGQWQNNDPAVSEWYRTLMRPDEPQYSCCGEADAYWADDVHVRDGKTYAKITDDRPDEPRRRQHRNIGEEFEIPPEKLKWDRSNPTGHAVLFLSVPNNYYPKGAVLCFVQGGGV